MERSRRTWRAATAGMGWPLPKGMSEAEVAQRLFPPTERKPVQSRHRVPDFALMHQELGRKGMTLLLLWQEYQAIDPATSYSYPHFCVRYQTWRKRLKLSLRQVHQAGEKLFVDYAGPTVPVVDSQTGGVRAASNAANSHCCSPASGSRRITICCSSGRQDRGKPGSRVRRATWPHA